MLAEPATHLRTPSFPSSLRLTAITQRLSCKDLEVCLSDTSVDRNADHAVLVAIAVSVRSRSPRKELKSKVVLTRVLRYACLRPRSHPLPRAQQERHRGDAFPETHLAGGVGQSSSAPAAAATTVERKPFKLCTWQQVALSVRVMAHARGHSRCSGQFYRHRLLTNQASSFFRLELWHNGGWWLVTVEKTLERGRATVRYTSEDLSIDHKVGTIAPESLDTFDQERHACSHIWWWSRSHLLSLGASQPVAPRLALARELAAP